MGMKAPTTCLNNWSHLHSPSPFPQTLAFPISSPSSRRRSFSDVAIVCKYMHTLESRSDLFGSKICSARSFELPKSMSRSITRSSNATSGSFSDEEFSKKIQESALRFQLSDDEGSTSAFVKAESFNTSNSRKYASSINFTETQNRFHTSMMGPPDWSREIIPACIERKANSMEIPVSLRIIKRKKQQWQEGFREVGESACCSVKKAFSSMLFIIRELQSYTMQMREILFYEDLQGILVSIQQEMNASFVWLFQQVFSYTPTLMVYVMILLANYSVHSMGVSTAIATITPPPAYTSTLESWSQDQIMNKFDSSAIKSFLVSSNGKTTSVGGINGGGGKFRSTASGTDGDGRFDKPLLSDFNRTVLPDGKPTRSSEESVSGQAREEEIQLWNSMVQEASNMQVVVRDGVLDHVTMQSFVSPVIAKIETGDFADYLRTEHLYQKGLSQEPTNSLLLANYAQFLYLVAHDYDRAEEYFKKAVKVGLKDADAVNKYASFLWQAKKDLWAAEQTYLDAISIDPTNSYYAANYAHFLWNTGGEDTCFPLGSPETTNEV